MSDTTILILFLVGIAALAALFFWALCRAAAKSWEDVERFESGEWKE